MIDIQEKCGDGSVSVFEFAVYQSQSLWKIMLMQRAPKDTGRTENRNQIKGDVSITSMFFFIQCHCMSFL